MGINWDTLSDAEAAVVEWQYRMCGGFMTTIWNAICQADEQNLAKLAKGFPVEVAGYKQYAHISGWWREVQEKAGIKEA